MMGASHSDPLTFNTEDLCRISLVLQVVHKWSRISPEALYSISEKKNKEQQQQDKNKQRSHSDSDNIGKTKILFRKKLKKK